MVKNARETKPGIGEYSRTVVMNFDGKETTNFSYVASQPRFRDTGDIWSGYHESIVPTVGRDAEGMVPFADLVEQLDSSQVTASSWKGKPSYEVFGNLKGESVTLTIVPELGWLVTVYQVSSAQGPVTHRRCTTIEDWTWNDGKCFPTQATASSGEYGAGSHGWEDRFLYKLSRQSAIARPQLNTYTKAPAGTHLISREDGTIYSVKTDGSMATWMVGQPKSRAVWPLGILFVASAGGLLAMGCKRMLRSRLAT